MDAGLTRVLAAATLVAALAAGAGLAPAQTSDTPDGSAQPPAISPAPGPVSSSALSPAAAPSPASPPPAAPSVTSTPVANTPAPVINAPATQAAAAPLPAPAAKIAPPPGPPRPIRTPTAVLQVLDKVTAETLRFEAPIGRPIRYKTLVMTVKACETRGADDPLPRPSAYMVIDSQPLTVPGHAPPPPKRVFTGWMFANGPALHPLQHPIYDAWLVACSTAAPSA